MRKRPEQTCCVLTEPVAITAVQLTEAARRAKALGDPLRLDMLRLIAAQELPVCACDIVARFGKSQSTTAHHLKLLCDAGLLNSQRSGLWSYYSVTDHGRSLMSHLLAD